MSRPTGAVRAKVRGRAGNRCELCGAHAGYFHLHHRTPRGMGGSIESWVNLPANLLWVCPQDHLVLIEQNRAYSLDRGWLLHRFQNPWEEPAKLWDGWWVLDNEGGKVSAFPEGDADR